MIYAVIAVFVLLVVIVVARIVAGARNASARNTDFFAGALVAHDLAPAASVEVAVPLVANAPHAVWLALELTAREPAFEVALAIRVGDTTILDGTYPVTFDDDEHDAHGLPNPPGISALNTSVLGLPGSTRITTTLRAFRFDAPPAAVTAQIRAKLVAGPGVTIARARVLVTSPDAPAGSGKLPAGMRAIGPHGIDPT